MVIIMAFILMVVIVLDGEGGRGMSRKDPSNKDIPQIDQIRHSEVRTATFALG
ncbi:MAG: hypothetical protein JSV21_09355 [Nitrospirota bacterium]|nr:MAG: hypothetical protein JSV21_09355 [Nitrospirota bacterium]